MTENRDADEHLVEPRRRTRIDRRAQVVVCGGGPAGVAAAVAAARQGALTTLIEVHGALGGIWTAGALSWIIDAALKPGIMAELIGRLESAGGHGGHGTPDFSYDVEVMKTILDQMCAEAGVQVMLHSRVVGVDVIDNTLRGVITESPSGRLAHAASVVVDATGNGDVAALAGCGFDVGHPDTGQVQPLSLMALVSGVHLRDIQDVAIAADVVRPGEETLTARARRGKSKTALLAEIRAAGVEPSYTGVSLFKIHDNVFALMANHAYGVAHDDTLGISQATAAARAEVHMIVNALRSSGGRWANLRLVSTAAQIGIREGRRIAGVYRVEQSDVLSGARHEDAVARVTFGFDVHSLTRAEGGYASPVMDGMKERAQSYDIPYRALVARDVNGLVLAGRCISGDFWAHSSYRVTGNAVATGQAAGVAAALCCEHGVQPHDLTWNLLGPSLPQIPSSILGAPAR